MKDYSYLIGKEIFIFSRVNFFKRTDEMLFEYIFGSKKGTFEIESFIINNVIYDFRDKTIRLTTDAEFNQYDRGKYSFYFDDIWKSYFFDKEEAEQQLEMRIKECEEKIRNIVNG